MKRLVLSHVILVALLVVASGCADVPRVTNDYDEAMEAQGTEEPVSVQTAGGPLAPTLEVAVAAAS